MTLRTGTFRPLSTHEEYAALVRAVAAGKPEDELG
jgi:hypothetical protein